MPIAKKSAIAERILRMNLGQLSSSTWLGSLRNGETSARLFAAYIAPFPLERLELVRKFPFDLSASSLSVLSRA